jgi:tetratricopeptide (TPR) repeat protein
LKCYDKAIEIDPNDANAWYNKGISLGKLETYEEALKCYDKAIEIDPNHAYAWRNKAVALVVLVFVTQYVKHKEENIKCLQKAIECYDKAIEIDPNDANAVTCTMAKHLALSFLRKFRE